MATPILCKGCNQRHDPLLRCPPANVLNTAVTAPGKRSIGDGAALVAIKHPPGLIDKIADAIRSGKLSPTPKADRLAKARELMPSPVTGEGCSDPACTYRAQIMRQREKAQARLAKYRAKK